MSKQFSMLTQQEGLRFHEEYGDLKLSYINHVVVTFNEAISVKALKKASNSLVCDFSIFRAHVAPSNNSWIVEDHITADFSYRLLSYSPESVDALLDIEMEDIKFHLSKTPLICFRLFQVSESLSYFIISYHHALLAGRCAVEILERLLLNYDRFLAGSPLLGAPEENNIALVQRIKAINTSEVESKLRCYFGKMAEPTKLPQQTISFSKYTYLSKLSFTSDIKRWESIREHCRNLKISPNLFFHLAWSLTLSWYVPQETFCFGVTREFPRSLTKGHAGFFMSTMPLVVTLTEKTSIRSLISDLKEQHRLFHRSVFVPYNVIRSYTNLNNNIPLFDSVIDFKPYSPEAFLHHRHPSWRHRRIDLRFTTHYPCFIEIYQNRLGSLFHCFCYHSKCFSTEWMQQLVQHYRQIVKLLIKKHRLDFPARKLNPYKETEIAKIQDKLRGSISSLMPSQSIWSCIKMQSCRYPKNIALVCGENQLTYAELILSVERTACYLRNRLELKIGDIVFVDLDRTIQLPIILLALHRVGVCFVPFNAEIMLRSLSKYIDLTGAKAIITDRSLNIRDIHCRIKKLTLSKSVWKGLPIDKNELSLPPYRISLTDLFYIIFTSGTTGNPKGARILQKGIMNFLNSLRERLSFKSDDCFFALSDYVFDIAYLELFLPLIAGGRCVIGTVCDKQSHTLILSRIKQHRVTMMQATPTYWRYLLSSKIMVRPPHSLTLISGGEILDFACAERLLAFGTVVWNAYGPTETTIWSSLHRITKDDIKNKKIPIGYPIANTTFHILNSYQQRLPQGVPGELYISGLGVADGYVTTDLEKKNYPFVSLTLSDEGPCIAYRTGDKVCLNYEGQLLFCCRYDEQIKLHGHRIELPYIENILMQYPSIVAGAIKVWGVFPRNYLVAYLVSKDSIIEEDIHAFLRKQLPKYMIPSQFVFLKGLPRTIQGKVNKEKLPLPHASAKNDYFSLNEKVVREIWSKTLDIPLNEIKGDSHFFQLGGHSLTAALVVQEVNKLFSLSLPIKIIFQEPTIRAFSAYLDKVEKSDRLEAAIPKTLLKKVPLSDQQLRLWTYEKLQPGTSVYNMFVSFELKGLLNVEALQYAFHFIVRKHAVLRTIIYEEKGKPVQIVQRENQKSLSFFNWSSEEKKLTDIKKRVKKYAYTIAQHNFQLDKEFPFIFQLIQCQKDYFVLIINVHHIVCDGWSLRLILSDLNYLYAKQLSQTISIDFPAAYPDFAVWQQKRRTESYLKEAKEYWIQYLQNAELAVLPYDRKPPEHSKSFSSGKRIQFSLGHALSKKIQGFSQENQCTSFVSMITVFAALLYRYTLIDRLIFYTVSDGRLTSSTQSIVGFFSNILPIVFDFSVQTDLISEIKKFIREFSKTITYQSVPWEILQLALPITSDQDSIGENKILFVQQDALENPIQWEGITAKRIFSDNETLLLSDYDSSKFDICVYIQWTKYELIGLVEYNSQKFYFETINELIRNYRRLLDSLINLPSQSISTAYFSLKSHKYPLPFEIKSEHLRYYPNIIESLRIRCKKQPDNIAIVDKDALITYECLWERTEALARALLTQVNNQNCIAVCLPATLNTLLIFIAIMRIGCPYLPIDPNQTSTRIEAILNDANPQALIVDANFSLQDSFYCRINSNDLFDCFLSTESNKIDLASITDCNPLAYLLYTSGSTGKPKGVQVTHNNLSHLLSAGEALFKFSEQPTVWSLVHSLGFDFSVWEMWGALLSGGTLVVISSDDIYHPKRFLQSLAKQQVSVLNITPSFFSLCLKILSTEPDLLASLGCNLKTIILGGESMTHCSLDLWFQLPLSERVSLFNMYGITEGTIHAACYSVTHDALLNRSIIGSAIPGMSMHVLDAHKHPVPIGIIGELHLEGYGVALGYLNPSPNDQNRFWELVRPNGSSRRFFQTGDLARLLFSGELEYIGRKDDQLCLRGYRVELAELRRAFWDFSAVKSVYLDVIECNEKIAVNAYVTVYKNDDELSHLELESNHIKLWKRLYNQVYNISQSKPTFNTVGWCNSATGKPIPDIEMREWRDLTLEKIKPLYDTSSHLAEIGCGTGLLLFSIAPEVAAYSGIDISEKIIANLQKHLASYSWSNKVTLLMQEASSFLSEASQEYNLIILNSVIQYFPNANYLWDIMNRAIDAIAPEGSIFIGDIRNFYRQTLYQHYVNSRNLGNGNISDEELLVDPNWFRYFSLQHPRVNYVKIDYKAGKYPNEMNYFRYDVIIGIERKVVSTMSNTMKVLPWKDLNVTDLLRQLHLSPTATRITDVPHRDLCELDHMSTENLPKKSMRSLIVPQDLARLARKINWELILPWSASNAMTEFDAILYPRKEINQIEALFYESNNVLTTFSSSNLARYCNDPLYQMSTYYLQEALTEHLNKCLPRYMQPNRISIISHLPLTLNGKIDHQALRAMNVRSSFSCKRGLPLTALENEVGMIWCTLLKQKNIESSDDFFALGGHSLLAIQLLSEIEKRYQVTLPIQDFYTTSTLSAFCRRLSDSLLQKVLPKMTKEIHSLKNSSIIMFQSEGQETPLFLIHPLGGTVFVYLDLLRYLRTNRPIYAIQDPGITRPNKQYTSLVALAREYRAWIQSIQPKGPYYLAGSSLGGTLAYEIAYQLEQEDCKNNYIIMFDSWALYTEDFCDRERLEKGLMRQYHFIKQKLGGVNLPQAQELINLNYQRLKLVLKYRPSILHQAVWLYKSISLREEFIPIDEPTNHWKRYCHGVIHTVPSPGDHETMLVGENAKKLAWHLEKVLQDSKQSIQITPNDAADVG